MTRSFRRLAASPLLIGLLIPLGVLAQPSSEVELTPKEIASGQVESHMPARLEAEAEVIEELRQELQLMRDSQRRSEDRIRALEDELAARESFEEAAPEYLERGFEAFQLAPKNRLFLSGYGTAEMVDGDDGDRDFRTNFNPVFHFRLTEKLHFMGELEIGLVTDAGETQTDVELELAQIDYLANDWVTLSAGKLFLPFNTFGPRLHPQWINKMASPPPIYGGHGSTGLIPILSEVGAMASGGTQLWREESKLNYALFVADGPSFDLTGHHGTGAHVDSHDATASGHQENAHDDAAASALAARSSVAGDDHHEESNGHDEAAEEEGDHGDVGEHHQGAENGHEDDVHFGDDHEGGENGHEDDAHVGDDHDGGEDGHADEGDHDDGVGLVPAPVATSSDSRSRDASFGGRIGLLPIPNLELGLSFMSGRASGSDDRFDLFGLDGWWRLGGLELRAELARLSRTRGLTIPDGWGYYVQGAYRARESIGAGSAFERFLSRLEPVIRWGVVQDADALDRDQLAFGVNYWLYESVPLKLAYELNDGSDNEDRFVVQLAYGF